MHDELKSLNFSFPNNSFENEDDVVIALNETQHYINIRQYEKSLLTIKKVEDKLKSCRDKKFLAECYIINNDYNRALNILLDLVKIDNLNCDTISLCSSIYLNTGDIANAIKHNDSILKINKNNKTLLIL